MVNLSAAVPGHPMLAERFRVVPEAASFRRFTDLASQDLLHRQAELIDLRDKLQRLQHEDYHSTDSKRNKYASNWKILSESERTGHGEQLALWEEIRPRLREYQKAFLRSHRVATLSDVDPADLSHVQQFLVSEDMGMPLEGCDYNTWGSTEFPLDHAPDLAALKTRNNEDFVSNWIRLHAIPPFHRCLGSKFKHVDPIYGIPVYRDNKIGYVAHLLITLVASTLLISSIAVLNAISSTNARLGAIAGFTILFAFCLNSIARCKSTDIFAIVSAFTAVQVVFISTNTYLPSRSCP